MSSLLKSKKAEEGTSYSLTQAIGIVIAVIVVFLLIVPLIANLYELFVEKADQGTIESFKALEKGIESSIEGNNKVSVTYYIDNGYKLVGFNKDQSSVRISTNFFSHSEQKPLVCGTSACIAICGDEKQGCTKSLERYKIFENIDKIIPDKSLKDNKGFGAVALYGNIISKKAYGVQIIYVEVNKNILVISS